MIFCNFECTSILVDYYVSIIIVLILYFLLLSFQTLFCIGHLCRVCPQLVPELLVECETELHLFNILFSCEEHDFDNGDMKDSG